jgi:hypothetical protein
MKPRRVTDIQPRKAKREHPLEWLAEPVQLEPTFVFKSWFGGRSIMLHGKHQLFLTTQGEPWQGVLVCTFHEHQPSLLAEIPALRQHPILGKWLYLPESTETFERDARRLVQPRPHRRPAPRRRAVTAEEEAKTGKNPRAGTT